ncbi:MAG TPA: glycosyltransferase [Rhizomicrobium sp.]|nr:glycosyltransferase [Rhizomicrobium sp.]
MGTAQKNLDRYVTPAAWADGLSSEGILHFVDGKNADEGLLRTPRAVVFWNGESPIGLNIANSFEDCASLTLPISPSSPECRPAGSATRFTKPSSVSLVICTRDRPRELARCLASLAKQTYAPDQIVVVDNASLAKDTEKVCQEADVIYVHEPRPGLDAARNAGARASTSEIVAYTDDDVVLHPRWLERLVEGFDAPEIWAVTGLVLPAELATPAQWHFERFWGFGRGFQRTDFGSTFLQSNEWLGCPVWLIGAGASMAFRRTVFDRVGFFDERLDAGAAGCSGDSEFWHRILCAGGTCRYEPSVILFHYHRREWAELRNQIRAYMRGHSAALLVQYEQSGRKGNLRRLFIYFPGYYLGRIVKLFVFGGDASSLFLREEIAGILSGIWFYLRTPRSRGTATA